MASSSAHTAGSASGSRTLIAAESGMAAGAGLEAHRSTPLDKGKGRAASPEDEMVNSGLHTPPASPLGLRGAIDEEAMANPLNRGARHGKEPERYQSQGAACSLLIPANRTRPSPIFSGYPTPDSPPRLHPGSTPTTGSVQRLSPEPMNSSARSRRTSDALQTSDAESGNSGAGPSSSRDVSASPSTRPTFGHLRDALDEVDLGDPFGLDLLPAPLGAPSSTTSSTGRTTPFLTAAPTPGLIGVRNSAAAPPLPRLGARRRPYASGASLIPSASSRSSVSGLVEADHRSIFGGLDLSGALHRGHTAAGSEVAADETFDAEQMDRPASTSSARTASQPIKRSFEQAALSPSSSPSRFAGGALQRESMPFGDPREVQQPVASGSSSLAAGPFDPLRSNLGDDSLDTSTSSMASASSHLYASPSAGRSSRASNKRQRADSGASSSLHGSIFFHEARSTLSHEGGDDGSNAQRPMRAVEQAAAPSSDGTVLATRRPVLTPTSRSSTSSMLSVLPAAAARRIALGLELDLPSSESEHGEVDADADADADDSGEEDSDAEQPGVTLHFAPALGSPSTRLAGNEEPSSTGATGTLTPSRITQGVGARVASSTILDDGDATMSWTSSVSAPDVAASPTGEALNSSTDGMTIRRRAGLGSRSTLPYDHVQAQPRDIPSIDTSNSEDSVMRTADSHDSAISRAGAFSASRSYTPPAPLSGPLPSARRHLGWPASASSSGVWASDGASTPTTADSTSGAPSGLRRRLGRLSRDEDNADASATTVPRSGGDDEAPARVLSSAPVGPQSLSDRLAELQAEVDSTVSELRSWRERNSALIERLRRSEAPPAPEIRAFTAARSGDAASSDAALTRSRPVPVPAPLASLSSNRLRPPPSLNVPTPPPRRSPTAAPTSGPDDDTHATVDTTVSQLNRWRERSRQLIEQLMENEDSFGLQRAGAGSQGTTEPSARETSTPSSTTPSLGSLSARRGMSVASRLTPSLRSSVPVGSSSTVNRFARSADSTVPLWGELAGAGRDEVTSRDSQLSNIDHPPVSVAGRRSGALGASGRLRGPTRRRNEDWLTSGSGSSGPDDGSATASGRHSTVPSLFSYPAASSQSTSSSTSLELPQLGAAPRDALDVPRLPDIRSRSPFAFDFAADDVQARSAGMSEPASSSSTAQPQNGDETDGSSSRRLRLRTLRLASRLTNSTGARSGSTDSALPTSHSDSLLQLGEPPRSANSLSGWTSSSSRYAYRRLTDTQQSTGGAESSEESSRDPFARYRDVPEPTANGLRPLRTPARLARRERLRDAIAAASAAEEGQDNGLSSTSSTADSFASAHTNAIDDLVEQVARRRARRLHSIRSQHGRSQDDIEQTSLDRLAASSETQPFLRGPSRTGTRGYSHTLDRPSRERDQEWLGPPSRSSDNLATATGASRPEVGGLGLFGRSSTLRARLRRTENDQAASSLTTRRELLLDDSQDSASEDEAPATLGHGDRERDREVPSLGRPSTVNEANPWSGPSTAAMNRFMARMQAAGAHRTTDVEHQPTLSRHILANSVLAASESRARAAAALPSSSRSVTGRYFGASGDRSTRPSPRHAYPSWRPQSSSSSTASSTAAASSTAGNPASSAASTSASSAAARWDRLLDSGFGAFGSLWDSSEAASSLSNSLGLPRLLLAELGAGDVAGNPANYMNDDEWLGRDSYEGLLRLSERIGDVKPKHTPHHVIDGLPTCHHSVWMGGSCKVEEPEVQGKGKGVDRGEAMREREAAAALVTDRDQQCPICLEEYVSTSLLMSAPCNHAFHESCLRTWLATSQSCPMCRQNVQPPSAVRQEASLLLPELAHLS